MMTGNLEFLCESFSDHFLIYKKSGILLCSHVVTNVVFSAGHVLTVVFGMGTGVTHDRIDTIHGTKWTRTTDLTLIRRAL